MHRSTTIQKKKKKKESKRKQKKKTKNKIAQKANKMRQRNGSRPNATLDPTRLAVYHAIVIENSSVSKWLCPAELKWMKYVKIDTRQSEEVS